MPKKGNYGKEQDPMPHLKLMKLLYIVERTSLQKNGYPVLGDKLFSMDHGPVLSITLDYISYLQITDGINGYHPYKTMKSHWQKNTIQRT